MEFDPEGRRLPIKVDTASNGEYHPRPLTGVEIAAKDHARKCVGNAARRLGVSRRAFLKTSAGAATTLLAFNEVYAKSGFGGGLFDIPHEAGWDSAMADTVVGGEEFIFDIQTHCVDPSGEWREGSEGKQWERVLNQVFSQRRKCTADGFDRYSAEQLVKEVFLDSDTDVAVVSALWGARDSNPTPIEYAAEARAIVDTLGDGKRALLHGGVLPNEPGALDQMEIQAQEFGVAAWKTYPQWGPQGTGYFMDDPEFGIPLIEKARELDVKVVCAHRGIPLGNLDYRYSHPADIARVARRFPDVTFICYHAGWEPGVPEGPYAPDEDKGVDRLIRAHQENGFGPNEGNLYAELGSTWRYHMSKPDEAAHLIGKLLRYFGEERICWGTDSLWYGSPQDQIQAFRAFQISEKWQDRYGYPPLASNARQNIFGLNAAKVYGVEIPPVRQVPTTGGFDRLREQYRAAPNPSFQTFGPRTRRQFLRLTGRSDGIPG